MSFSAPLGCTLIPGTSGACCRRRAGACSSRASGRRNATSKPSKSGTRSAGPPKKAADEGYPTVWGDESGFSLLPLAVRTWAPRGQTPVLRVKLTREHLSAVSGLTLDGRICLPVQEAASTAETVVGFLRQLLRQIRGKVLVIGDGASIHKGQPVKDYLAAGAAKRLHLERLPAYAPDLNPAEGIWSYVKGVELRNRCCRDSAELRQELDGATARLRHKRLALQACSRQCGYSIESRR